MYKRSWLNISMLIATIPSYSSEKDENINLENSCDLEKLLAQTT